MVVGKLKFLFYCDLFLEPDRHYPWEARELFPDSEYDRTKPCGGQNHPSRDSEGKTAAKTSLWKWIRAVSNSAVLRLSEARCGERKWELTLAFSCHSNWRGCYQSITFVGGRARSLFSESVYASNVLYLMAPRLLFHPFQPTLSNWQHCGTHTWLTQKFLTYAWYNDAEVYAPIASCWNFDLVCKHNKHKTAFLARKVTGTFEKQAHGSIWFSCTVYSLTGQDLGFFDVLVDVAVAVVVAFKASLGSIASAGFVETSQQLTLKKQIRFSVNFLL